MEKREGGSNIIFPTIYRLLGRTSSGKKLKGTKILEKKINTKKMGWGRISSCREFHTPLQEEIGKWKNRLKLKGEEILNASLR